MVLVESNSLSCVFEMLITLTNFKKTAFLQEFNKRYIYIYICKHISAFVDLLYQEIWTSYYYVNKRSNIFSWSPACLYLMIDYFHNSMEGDIQQNCMNKEKTTHFSGVSLLPLSFLAFLSKVLIGHLWILNRWLNGVTYYLH